VARYVISYAMHNSISRYTIIKIITHLFRRPIA